LYAQREAEKAAEEKLEEEDGQEEKKTEEDTGCSWGIGSLYPIIGCSPKLFLILQVRMHSQTWNKTHSH
jgi:hypothetical protein